MLPTASRSICFKFGDVEGGVVVALMTFPELSDLESRSGLGSVFCGCAAVSGLCFGVEIMCAAIAGVVKQVYRVNLIMAHFPLLFAMVS